MTSTLNVSQKRKPIQVPIAFIFKVMNHKLIFSFHQLSSAKCMVVKLMNMLPNILTDTNIS